MNGRDERLLQIALALQDGSRRSEALKQEQIHVSKEQMRLNAIQALPAREDNTKFLLEFSIGLTLMTAKQTITNKAAQAESLWTLQLET